MPESIESSHGRKENHSEAVGSLSANTSEGLFALGKGHEVMSYCKVSYGWLRAPVKTVSSLLLSKQRWKQKSLTKFFFFL